MNNTNTALKPENFCPKHATGGGPCYCPGSIYHAELGRQALARDAEEERVLAVIARRPTEAPEEQVPTDGLFVVWFDLNGGVTPHDWWWEEPGPQPLKDALEEAADMRLRGWVAQVWPEHLNPRADGRWDNP